MILRAARAVVAQRLKQFPVVALLGPRQVGKTTLARQLTQARGATRSRYLDLELSADLARLADAASYLEAQRGRLVVLDEVHRAPEIFRALRVVVDRRIEAGELAGHFLVLGSASLDLLRQSSETLAGRIAFVELTPVRLDELSTTGTDLNALWLRGGFPRSLLAADDRSSLRWRWEFVRTYLERDVAVFGARLPAETLRRFWTMLAHTQGQQANIARLAAGLGISGRSVGRYLDLMVDLLLVRRLTPWVGNVGKRLVKAPKVYVRDSGIVHALLDIETLDDLYGHPVAGASWEGAVLETLISAAGTERVAFYRTSAGAEIDLVIEGSRGRRLAIEVKRSSAPTVSKGFRIGVDDLRASGGIVVYPGEERFPLGGGVEAMGPADAVAWIRRRGETRRP
jgi:hypothetical protein